MDPEPIVIDHLLLPYENEFLQHGVDTRHVRAMYDEMVRQMREGE